MRTLTAIPIYNEARHLEGVLDEVRKYSSDILVVNDGSTDETPALLARQRDLHQIIHQRNFGYGAAIRSAFGFALAAHGCLLWL